MKPNRNKRKPKQEEGKKRVKPDDGRSVSNILHMARFVGNNNSGKFLHTYS
jgi:hypothetical protein